MSHMRNYAMGLEDLSLLVRALHRDVSELDERLRRVETALAELDVSVAEVVSLDLPAS